MNILYLSHLSGASYAGPTYSVPKQIEAQSRLDNVFWYNAVIESSEEWKKRSYYHDLNEYPNESIYVLPEPFNKPDLIVVELFYNMAKSKMIYELLKGAIPYIIIPRGELTAQAQKRKFLKKLIANIVLFKKYARNAIAIQYLTAQECLDSGELWNSRHLIIPNGIDIPKVRKVKYSNATIKCILIGRMEPYQKGLDILINACEFIKDDLKKSKCQILICGPDYEGKVAELKKIVYKKGLDSIISFKDGVYGKEKENLLLDSDVFLIPSRFEGHPMALIEALSYGLPCVATTGSNMKNVVEEYNAGWTADNDEISVKKALQAMIRDTVYFSRKGQNAILLSEEYDWNNIANKTHEMYERLLQGDKNEKSNNKNN